MDNKKIISISRAYEVCNNYHLFTAGTNFQYDKFFELCKKGITINELKIVLSIVSDVKENILDIAVSELYGEPLPQKL